MQGYLLITPHEQVNGNHTFAECDYHIGFASLKLGESVDFTNQEQLLRVFGKSDTYYYFGDAVVNLQDKLEYYGEHKSNMEVVVLNKLFYPQLSLVS